MNLFPMQLLLTCIGKEIRFCSELGITHEVKKEVKVVLCDIAQEQTLSGNTEMCLL